MQSSLSKCLHRYHYGRTSDQNTSSKYSCPRSWTQHAEDFKRSTSAHCVRLRSYRGLALPFSWYVPGRTPVPRVCIQVHKKEEPDHRVISERAIGCIHPPARITLTNEYQTDKILCRNPRNENRELPFGSVSTQPKSSR